MYHVSLGKYDPMWYSLPYSGATTFQKMNGPIPVLPVTGDEMEANPVFPKLWRKKKVQGHTRFNTNGSKNTHVNSVTAKIIMLQNVTNHMCHLS